MIVVLGKNCNLWKGASIWEGWDWMIWLIGLTVN
jgi:hypothetical protein